MRRNHDIYKDTILLPNVLADIVCDETNDFSAREKFADKLEARAVREYQTNPQFRELLASCLIHNPKPGVPEDARRALLQTMRDWIKDLQTQNGPPKTTQP